MTGSEIAILATIAPLLLAVVVQLIRVANLMGRLTQKLDDHDERLITLEQVLPRSVPPTSLRPPRRTSAP